MSPAGASSSWTWLLNRPVDLLSLVSAALSNLVSNVPAVLLLEPVAQAVPTQPRDRLAGAGHVEHVCRQSHGAGFGGQFDRRGKRRPRGVTISFWEYCKVGIPLTVLTLLLGIAWLQIVHY